MHSAATYDGPRRRRVWRPRSLAEDTSIPALLPTDHGSPLGGRAISRDPRTGVVILNLCVHNVEGLSIADGWPPGPVGINPAMTIAALADRHGERLAAHF